MKYKCVYSFKCFSLYYYFFLYIYFELILRMENKSFYIFLINRSYIKKILKLKILELVEKL